MRIKLAAYAHAMVGKNFCRRCIQNGRLAGRSMCYMQLLRWSENTKSHMNKQNDVSYFIWLFHELRRKLSTHDVQYGTTRVKHKQSVSSYFQWGHWNHTHIHIVAFGRFSQTRFCYHMLSISYMSGFWNSQNNTYIFSCSIYFCTDSRNTLLFFLGEKKTWG